MLVLRAFSHLAEARVIAILLPPFCVAARGLDVTIGKRANPHIGPGGWDRERLDSLQHVRLGEPRPVSPCVGESRSCLLAATADSAASLGSTITCVLSGDSFNKRMPFYFATPS